MTELNVSPEALADASTRIRESAEDLQSRFSVLGSRVEALLGTGWQGAAADSVARDWRLWVDGSRKVVAGLDAMAGVVDAAGRGFVSQDEGFAGSLNLGVGHA